MDGGDGANDGAEGQAPPGDASGVLALLHRLEALKHLPRAGWVDREVESPETVAAHSWRLAMMAWLLAEGQGLDAARAMRMALVHDLPEAITGDRTPFDEDGATAEARRALASDPPPHPAWRSAARREAKQRRERAALEEILAGAPAPLAGGVRAAWEEYEAGASPEARLVSQLDKLEAYLQGREYADAGRMPHPRTLASFRLDCRHLLTLPAVRALLAALEDSVADRTAPGE